MDARDDTGRDGAEQDGGGNGRRADRFGSLAWLSDDERHLAGVEADDRPTPADGRAREEDPAGGSAGDDEPALHGEVTETGPRTTAFGADAAGLAGTAPAAIGDGLATPLSAAGQLEGTGVLDNDDGDFGAYTVPDDLSTFSFAETGIAATGMSVTGIAATDVPATDVPATGVPEAGVPETGTEAAAAAFGATAVDPDLEHLVHGPAAHVELPPTFPLASEPAAGPGSAAGIVTGPGPVPAGSVDGWRSPRPLPPTVAEKRRRWPKVLALLLMLVAIAGVVIALANRADDGAVSSGTGSTAAVATAASTSVQPGTTAAASAAAPVTTTANTASPGTTASSATVVAPPTTPAAPATTGVVATPATPVAAEDAIDLFTPVRWAIFDNGKVQLLGRVPNQQIADTIATKAAAVVGRDNVQVGYTIDPNAPLPPSAPLYVKDLVLFDPSSAALKPASYPLLDLGVVLLQQNPGVRIRVIGRTDNRGDPNKNLLLSLDRAQAVIDYVTSKGIDPTRLTPVPLGAEAAVGDNATPDGQAQNRSVAFVITGLLS